MKLARKNISLHDRMGNSDWIINCKYYNNYGTFFNYQEAYHEYKRPVPYCIPSPSHDHQLLLCDRLFHRQVWCC